MFHENRELSSKNLAGTIDASGRALADCVIAPHLSMTHNLPLGAPIGGAVTVGD